jgi:hypothetical protein
MTGDAIDINRDDYAAWLAETGLTEHVVRRAVDDRHDHIDMPPGFDAAVVAPSPLEGCGMFATRVIEAGEHIGPARIGQCRTLLGRMTNHAKRPSCMFAAGSGGNIEVFAIRRIERWEELTIDYRQAARVNPVAVEQALRMQAGDPVVGRPSFAWLSQSIQWAMPGASR